MNRADKENNAIIELASKRCADIAKELAALPLFQELKALEQFLQAYTPTTETPTLVKPSGGSNLPKSYHFQQPVMLKDRKVKHKHKRNVDLNNTPLRDFAWGERTKQIYEILTDIVTTKGGIADLKHVAEELKQLGITLSSSGKAVGLGAYVKAFNQNNPSAAVIEMGPKAAPGAKRVFRYEYVRFIDTAKIKVA